MKVYIAAPFFNERQIEIVQNIERILDEQGFDYYSPRIHSGSHKLSSDQKKNLRNWKPVFESNIRALHEAHIVLAVLQYAMPTYDTYYTQLAVIDRPANPGMHFEVDAITPIEIPDTGVVFEIGYRYGLNMVAPERCENAAGGPNYARIVGWHESKSPDKLNLMLQFPLDGFLVGYDELRRYLIGGPDELRKVGGETI